MGKKGAGSQLKNLKSALRESGIRRDGSGGKSGGKKSGGGGGASESRLQHKSRDDKEAKLAAIRERFNPFELQVNHAKFAIGGRKIKGDQGRPGAAASASERMRKETLGRRRDLRGRTGGVVDRRFGEGRADLTPEEIQLERFTRERQRAGRRNVFSLEDDAADDDGLLGADADVGLTHMGQSLSEMQDFGPAPDDLEDDDMGAEMVSRANFGGFEGEDDLEEDAIVDEHTGERRKKTKREIMDDIIARSKASKYERQRQAEEDEDAREALDAELGDLQELLAQSQGGRPQAVDGDINPDRLRAIQQDTDYDRAVKELIYDRRAQATERTKTEEELIEEEARHLHEQEEARLKRMRGEQVDDVDDTRGGKRRRRAAQGDDLSDDFQSGSEDDEEDENVFGVGVNASSAAEVALDDDVASVSDRSSAGDDDDDDEEDDDALEANETQYFSAEDGSIADDDAQDDDEDDEDDDHDLPSEELIAAAKAELKRRGEGTKAKTTLSESTPSAAPKAILDSPSELKYTYPCPSSVAQLDGLIRPLSTADQLTALHRMKVLHHPKLNPANNAKLSQFLTVLVDYVLDGEIDAAVRDHCVRQVYELAGRYWEVGAKHFHERLDRVRQALYKDVDAQWGLPELRLFSLIGQVWSVSDAHHRVATPALLIAAQYLAQNEPTSFAGHAVKVTLCQILLHWVKDSKRFIPEMILALRQALEAVETAAAATAAATNAADVEPLSIEDPATFTAESVRKTASETTLAFAQLYTALPGYIECFTPLLALVRARERVPLETSLSNVVRSRRPLALQTHRAIGLQSFVPKFEEGFNPDKKSYDRDADRQRQSKLKAEVRDARRGAVRVLRRDAAFEARAKAEERRSKDNRYRAKMGKIEGRLRQPDF